MDKVIVIDQSQITASAPRLTQRLDIKNNGSDVKHNLIVYFSTLDGNHSGFKGPEKLGLKEGVSLDISGLKLAIASAQLSWEDDCARIRRRTETVVSERATGFQFLSCTWWGTSTEEETFFFGS